MKYIVKTIVSESHGFYLCSLVYTGLSSLARQGIIRHHYLAPEDATRESQHFHACSVWMEVECQYTPLKRKICIELHDRSDFVATGLLEACDVYYKRSYFQPDLNSLSEWQRRKIKPFGLNFACRSSESLTDLMCAIGPRLARHILWQSIHRSERRLSETLANTSGFLLSPNITTFEQSPESVVEPSIVFQPRVWEKEDTGVEDSCDFNRERVEVLRALREAFPGRFRGGLVPTELARNRYPESLTNQPCRRSKYIRMAKRNLIAIYTRGLHQSLAFKLAESLAASQCIVSEPLRNELPVPLVDGEHYLLFRNPDECIAACRRLLNDPELAGRMRRANHAYYEENVRPDRAVLRCLEQSFASDLGGSPTSSVFQPG